MDATLNGALLRVKSAAGGVNLAFGRLGAESTLTNFMNNLAAALRFVAFNLDTILKSATAAGAALLIAFGPKILAGMVTGLTALGGRIAVLNALILANPFVALAAVVVGLTTALVLFRNEIDLVGKDFITLGTVMTATWTVIKGQSDSGVEALKENMDDFKTQFSFS
jgi:hypothetical protein